MKLHEILGLFKKLAHRTGPAYRPYPALGQDLTPSPTTDPAHAKYQILQLRNDNTNLRVWVFAEPISEAFAQIWDGANLTPPQTLIKDADDFLELQGSLVNAMPDIFAFDMMPLMTDEKRRSLVDVVASGAQWMRYSGSTEIARYSVIVIAHRADFSMADFG
jgi:hypothetical protein